MLDVKLELTDKYYTLEYAVMDIEGGRPYRYMPSINMRKKLVHMYPAMPKNILIVCLSPLTNSYVSESVQGYLELREMIKTESQVSFTDYFDYYVTYYTDFIQFDYLRYFADILVLWKNNDEINCLSLLKMLNNEHRDFFGNKEIRREHNAWKLIKGALSAKGDKQ